MKSALFWDITQRRVVISYRITILRCIISKKSANLIYITAEAWYLQLQQINCVLRLGYPNILYSVWNIFQPNWAIMKGD
jgi:hypothetical protein